MYCFIDSVFRIYLEIILELFFFHFADCCRQTMRLRIEHLKIPEFSVCYVCFKISTRPIKIKWIKGVPIMLEFLRLVYSLRFWKKNVHEALIWTLKNFRLSNSNMASAATSRLGHGFRFSQVWTGCSGRSPPAPLSVRSVLIRAASLSELLSFFKSTIKIDSEKILNLGICLYNKNY